MSGFTVTDLTFAAEPASVGRARRAVRQVLIDAGATHLVDSAELVVSELVTNAVVHAGTQVALRVTAEAGSVRVEVEDFSPHLPVRRRWAKTSGTGRGLQIVDAHADRWSAARTHDGKVVWFEMGQPTVALSIASPAPDRRSDTVEVILRQVPLLMHWAWQEHASALLREYLLYALEHDVNALDQHAAASNALSVLHEQLPAPQLPTDTDALMASSVEPSVTADELVLHVPTASTPNFAVLNDLLARAVDAAHNQKLLGPPTQPEVAEMREWLCGEVSRQNDGAQPIPWTPRTDIRVQLEDTARRSPLHRQLARSDVPLIATDDASVIVAATPSLLHFLGYNQESDLLGRRILVLVPTRFHQAHIAGTTLHATNGREALLHQWLTVPVVRADGSEVSVALHVQPERLSNDVNVYVARFQLPTT